MPSLGKDLAAVRKKLNLSVEDIHNATKIPLRILNAIEDDSIFSGIEENTTYIRSYVRSYAKALDIDDDLIVEALNQVEEGNYNGLIIRGSEVRPSSDQTKEGEKGKKDSSPASDMVHDHAPEMSASRKEDSSAETSEEKQAPGSHSAGTKPPSVDSVDWADMGRKFTPLEKNSRIWIGVTGLLIVLVGVAFFFWYQYTGSTSQENTAEIQDANTQQAVNPDSLQLNLSNAPQGGAGDDTTLTASNTTPAESLSDTLTLVIYAAYDKLEPVRVYTDVMDSLNPYWIEKGEAYKFDFVNTIRFRGQYSRMILFLNGHVIEDFRRRFLNSQSGMVEINRSFFEGDPKWLQPPPDSLNIDAPPPVIIKDRPIFN